MIGKKEKAESGNVHKVFITFVMTIFCKTGGGGLIFTDNAEWLCRLTAPHCYLVQRPYGMAFRE